MFSDQTTVWKLPLRSRRPDFENEPDKVEQARKFCFEERWVGIGWQLDAVEDRENRPEIYEAALVASKRTDINVNAVLSAHRALARALEENDLVWCRARGDIYWIGRVVGPWEYRCVGKFDAFDLYQVRKCEWRRLGPSDLVPGPVKNAYAGRGAAITRIQREADEARKSTVAIWHRLGGESPRESADRAGVRLSALGHDDLEDIVLLYLQAELGWRVVVSTAKKSTPFTECILRSDDGRRAYVQVKSGSAGLSGLDEIPPEVDILYVFNGNDEYNWIDNDRIHPISREKLLSFASRKRSLMPPQVRDLTG